MRVPRCLSLCHSLVRVLYIILTMPFPLQEGLINTAWGSHVYYTSVAVFDQTAMDF